MLSSVDYLDYQLGCHRQDEKHVLNCVSGAHKPISYVEYIPVFKDDSEFLDRIQSVLNRAAGDLIVCSINTSVNNLDAVNRTMQRFKNSNILFVNSSCTGSFEIVEHLIPLLQNDQYEGITYITISDRARHIHSDQINVMNWYGDGYGELRLSNSNAGRELKLGKTIVNLASTNKDKAGLEIRSRVRLIGEYVQYQRQTLQKQISHQSEVKVGLPYLDEGNAEYFRKHLNNRLIQPSIEGLAWLPGLHWLVTLKDNYYAGKLQVILQGYGYNWSSVQIN